MKLCGPQFQFCVSFRHRCQIFRLCSGSNRRLWTTSTALLASELPLHASLITRSHTTPQLTPARERPPQDGQSRDIPHRHCKGAPSQGSAGSRKQELDLVPCGAWHCGLQRVHSVLGKHSDSCQGWPCHQSRRRREQGTSRTSMGDREGCLPDDHVPANHFKGNNGLAANNSSSHCRPANS